MTVKFAAALLLVAAVGTSAATHAAGNKEQGQAKAVTCAACHGVDGNSVNPEWPSLAGQNARYTAEQLQMFRKAHRNNEVMVAQAQIIASDEDVADLAAYYASLTPTGLEADPSYWKAGEALYRGGDRARSIPACQACHGPVGRGNPGAGYPALRAQHSVYTVKQLTDYAADTRYTGADGTKHKSRNGHMMTTISRRLTAEDIRNLASYIQGMR